MSFDFEWRQQMTLGKDTRSPAIVCLVDIVSKFEFVPVCPRKCVWFTSCPRWPSAPYPQQVGPGQTTDFFFHLFLPDKVETGERHHLLRLGPKCFPDTSISIITDQTSKRIEMSSPTDQNITRWCPRLVNCPGIIRNSRFFPCHQINRRSNYSFVFFRWGLTKKTRKQFTKNIF